MMMQTERGRRIDPRDGSVPLPSGCYNQPSCRFPAQKRSPQNCNCSLSTRPTDMTCPIGTDVKHAAAIVRRGGLVAFPTETVYGLGAAALDVEAVARLFAAKARPRFDPLIVHIAELDELEQLAASVPEPARKLAQRFWPGPLTLVLVKTDAVPDLVTAGLPTVAIRIPDHPLALQLLRHSRVPLAAPSANKFGRLSPTLPAHVAEQLGDEIDYILDGGPCRVGVESTVLSLADEAAKLRPVILRPGGLPAEEIASIIGPVAVAALQPCDASHAQPSPGMLKKHYAPRTPLLLADENTQLPAGKRIGRLAFMSCDPLERFAAVEILSQRGDLTEAAANFFAALRRLDAEKLDLIAAEPLPEEGLGRALNDRLRRAAHL